MTKVTKYKIEVTAGMLEESTYFETLRMRMIDEGLLITARSPAFATAISAAANRTPTGKASTQVGTDSWKNGKFFSVNRAAFPPRQVEGLACFYAQGIHYFYDSCVNVPWLLHVGLGEGFELVVPYPISMNDFEDYFTRSCAAIQDIYRQVLRKGELEATFKVLEGEEEERAPVAAVPWTAEELAEIAIGEQAAEAAVARNRDFMEAINVPMLNLNTRMGTAVAGGIGATYGGIFPPRGTDGPNF